MSALFAQSGAPTLPDPDLLSLTWTAPESCPQREQIVADTRRLAGYPDQHQELIAVGRVVFENEGRWRAEVKTHMSGIDGERVLEGTDCQEVSEAVALVLALMIKPEREEPAPEREPIVVEADAGEPLHVPASLTVQEDRAAAIRLRVAAALGVGTLPGWAAGGELHGVVGWRWWSLELRGGLWFPTSADSPNLDRAGGRFWMFEGGPLACLFPWDTAVRLDTCVGGYVTRLSGRGFGITDPAKAAATFGSLLVEQAASVSLMPRLQLRLALQGLWPMSRPRFNIEQLGTVHRPSRIAWRSILAAEFGF